MPIKRVATKLVLITTACDAPTKQFEDTYSGLVL
jgi:hypothetical protein